MLKAQNTHIGHVRDKHFLTFRLNLFLTNRFLAELGSNAIANYEIYHQRKAFYPVKRHIFFSIADNALICFNYNSFHVDNQKIYIKKLTHESRVSSLCSSGERSV